MPLVTPKKIQFGKDAEEELQDYVIDNCRYWLARTKNFRENKLKEFAKIYKGTPKAKTKNTPWPNAANNVIQLAATQCDQLLSRVMSIYMVEPIWPVISFGDATEQEQFSADDQVSALEKFMTNSALDSDMLDLYRIEQVWWSSAVRNGTGVVKAPYEYTVEKQLISGEFADSTTGATKPLFRDFTRYDGPRPNNVPLNKFVNDLNYPRLEDSPFKFEINTMSKHQLRARTENGLWDKDLVEKIIAMPDRSQKDVLQEYVLEQQGINEATRQGTIADEYDILEVWFTYWHNGSKFSLFAFLHDISQTWLGCFYNYYPKNLCIYEDAKLAYDDEQYLGYGLSEMLEGYQSEVSTTHNQRTDAGTLNNTTAFRINKNSKLHSILTFYPGVMVPADKDEIERLDTSNPYASDINSETLTVSYAKERSGVDPAMGGTGGGIVNSKRGIYSASGTFAALQQQNNRTSLRTSDMRSAHTRLGNKLANIYAYFGFGSKFRGYGTNTDVVRASLESVKNGKLGLLIRPASASINKEMEKQNDILLSQNLERLYAGDAQILQSLATPGMPPELADYYKEVLKAKNAFMKHMLRNFNYADIDRLIPVPAIIKENRNATVGRPGMPNQNSLPQGGGQATLPLALTSGSNPSLPAQ